MHFPMRCDFRMTHTSHLDEKCSKKRDYPAALKSAGGSHLNQSNHEGPGISGAFVFAFIRSANLRSAALRRRLIRRHRLHKLQRPDQVGLQIPAVPPRVEKTLIEQELGALESFRQFLADGLLDHARA